MHPRFCGATHNGINQVVPCILSAWLRPWYSGGWNQSTLGSENEHKEAFSPQWVAGEDQEGRAVEHEQSVWPSLQSPFIWPGAVLPKGIETEDAHHPAFLSEGDWEQAEESRNAHQAP